MRVLQVLHDFLPRHAAGIEIAVHSLSKRLGSRFDVTVLAAEYDPSRPHGSIDWRIHDGVSVVEIVNNYDGASLNGGWSSPAVERAIEQVLEAVTPDLVHVHALQNLSLRLPTFARRFGAATVATLHDFFLLCPSGGQRFHTSEGHLCRDIDFDRCGRCYAESPYQTQVSYARFTRRAELAGPLYRTARRLQRAIPAFPAIGRSLLRSLPAPLPTAAAFDDRMTEAREQLERFDLVTAPSRFLAEEMFRFGFSRPTIEHVPNGIDPIRVDRRPTSKMQPLRLAFVGTVAPHKGLHVLLDALRRIEAARFSLRVWGSLDAAPEYCAAIRESAEGLPVELCGPFSRARAREVYEGADVLIVPSLWFENAPLVILEALSAGIPVVASRIGGIPELVRDGENGCLFTPGSSEELGSSLIDLADHPELFEKLRSGITPPPTTAESTARWETLYASLRPDLLSSSLDGTRE